ncbi:MAG: hypothetical protein ACJA16_004797 [Akkermansiaceae bacterium]|jgi:hypothetical protein
MNCCDQGNLNLGWAGWPQGMPGALLEVGALPLIRRIQRFRFLKSQNQPGMFFIETLNSLGEDFHRGRTFTAFYLPDDLHRF